MGDLYPWDVKQRRLEGGAKRESQGGNPGRKETEEDVCGNKGAAAAQKGRLISEI